MRRFAIGLLASSLLTLFTSAQASSLGARMERAVAAPSPEGTSRTRRLSSDDIADGLKSMLTDGASLAVIKLGSRNGFGEVGSSHVSSMTGGDRAGVDDRHLIRAAESTASQAGPILREAINALYFPDPQALLDGGPTAATQFLRDHAAEHIRTGLRPAASRSYTATWKPAAGAIAATIPRPSSRIVDHLAHTTVEALLHVIGDQEMLIRRSPAARGTPQLVRLFGRTA